MTAPGLWLIDSSIYIFRSYFALEPRWQSRDGLATEAVYGFASFLLKMLAAERPDFVAAAFDESLESGFRHRLDPGYKANRALPDEALAFQLDACRRVAEALGVVTLASPEYEADDLIATLAARARGRFRVHILSGDKDLAQLLEGDTRLQDYGRGDGIERDAFIASRTITPELVPDFLALVGDAADCIPGVPGIGPVTATALLSHLGPLECWLHRPEQAASVPVRGARQLPARLTANRERIELSLSLVRLVDNVPVARSEDDLRRQPVDEDAVAVLFEELGIQGLLPRLRTLAGAEA